MLQIEDFMRKAQQKIEEVQANLSQIRVTGEAGAGLVKVTINGRKKLLALDIDSTLFKPKEKKTTEDLIVAAINMATTEVEQQIQQQLPIPPGLADLTS